jgi:hypothetical protein
MRNSNDAVGVGDEKCRVVSSQDFRKELRRAGHRRRRLEHPWEVFTVKRIEFVK